MTLLAWVIAVFFAALLVVTLLSQLRRVPPVMWLKRHDAFALIPAWTFFAPNPGTRDVRVLWRQRYPDGLLSPWRETTAPSVGPWKGLWNPSKRVRKAVTDVSPSVLRRAVNFPDSQLTVISVPYLMLANHVCSLPGAEMANARQFLIAYTDGAEGQDRSDPRVQFISHWHRVEAAPGRRPAATGRRPALERTVPAHS